MTQIKEIVIYDDVILMDRCIKSYLSEYAPAGYDSSVTVKVLQSYLQWQEGIIQYEVTFTRDRSCE